MKAPAPVKALPDCVLRDERSCPQCAGPAIRIRRSLADRVKSIFVPVQRYRCRSLACHWEGTLRITDANTESVASTRS